jgi:hypothetical protein
MQHFTSSTMDHFLDLGLLITMTTPTAQPNRPVSMTLTVTGAERCSDVLSAIESLKRTWRAEQRSDVEAAAR